MSLSSTLPLYIILYLTYLNSLGAAQCSSAAFIFISPLGLAPRFGFPYQKSLETKTTPMFTILEIAMSGSILLSRHLSLQQSSPYPCITPGLISSLLSTTLDHNSLETETTPMFTILEIVMCRSILLSAHLSLRVLTLYNQYCNNLHGIRRLLFYLRKLPLHIQDFLPYWR
jgi:hypothetical protein